MARYGIPGMAVGIIGNDGVLYLRGYGMAYGEYVKRFIFEPLAMSHRYGSHHEAEADGLARTI